MHKIIFVSIILLIALFSLQLGMRNSLQEYYGSGDTPPVQLQAVRQMDTSDWREDYEVVPDSNGVLYLREREDLIAL